MIVAITGGTGFIGRHLAARHIARGDVVRYLTRNSTSVTITGASPVRGDLNSSGDDLRKFARGADVLYHCAAELRVASNMQRINVTGTANLITASDGEIGRWVQLSSTGVYGKRMSGEVNEDTPVQPANAYETSKFAADELVFEAAAKRNFFCVVVRPSNVYGADMSNQSLFQMIDKIQRGLFFYIGKPGAVANYVPVENVVDALVLCGTATLPANGKTYIVSDHRVMETFVGAIAAGLGVPPPRIRLPETLIRGICKVAQGLPGFPLSLSRIDALTNRVVFRADRIQTELKFEHRITLEAGVQALAHAWKNRSIGA